MTSEQTRVVLQTVFTNFRRERAAETPADQPRDHIERQINTPIYLRSAANGPSGLRQNFERPLWVLGLIAVLVLLIACSNVASLLIARAAARDLIVGMLSTSQTVVRLDLHLDWRVLAFLTVAGSMTTFLFGLAPA